MISDDLKQELIKKKNPKNKSIARLAYLFYRYLASWHRNSQKSKELLKIHPGSIALLANLCIEGLTNKELASRSIVSKQAMSKLVNSMLKENYIEISKDNVDNRANRITLTDKGAEMLVGIWETDLLMIKDIEEKMGKAKAEQLMELLSEFIDTVHPGKK